MDERASTAPQNGKLPRCARCGFALVRAEALADADGDPFLGATVAGRFVVTARLGAGSMGTVYRARQEAMGRDVAIKILRSDRAFDAQAKARFTREARAMSLLASPHTVTVFDFGEIPDDHGDELGRGASLYLAMELLEGESLGARLKRLKRLPVEQAARIARHALLSLAEAHEKGVIHRDLKPDNLFLARAPGGAEEGEICKVLDFGIAKVVSMEAAAVDALETQAGTVFGTPRYMSPEQAQGKALDARSDLYSLGVLLYQMLVGRPPFVDDDAVVVMARHIKTVPVAPVEAAPGVGIPQALSDVVMRALAKDPNDRPASARDLIAELDAAVSRRASERPPRSEAGAAATGELAAMSRDDLEAPTSVSKPPRGRSVAWVGVGAALVVGAAVAFVSVLRHGGASTMDATATT
ncbi:MAG TPA: serine/threonine-protein kinase, partial [Minicystis sp.]|nr:serine/threonine-protein kinase [Minicystis sp.]